MSLDHRPAPARSSLSRRLNEEWRRLAAEPSARARVARWNLNLDVAGGPPAPDPTNLDLGAASGRLAPDRTDVVGGGRAGAYPTDLDVVLAASADRRHGMEPADAVLAALVRRARDDELAARIVLQRLVPGLVTIAARRARRSPGGGREAQALFDDLAANAWLLIRSYPIERRPRKIAVNLLRDTEYQTCVRWHRLRAATEVAVGHPNDEEAAPVTDLMGRRVDQRPSADEVAAVLAAGAAAGVEGADLRLLSSLYLDDRPLAEVAKSMRCTVRTVRNLRALATARLRSAVLAPAA